LTNKSLNLAGIIEKLMKWLIGHNAHENTTNCGNITFPAFIVTSSGSFKIKPPKYSIRISDRNGV
jgi:hypothetical protein